MLGSFFQRRLARFKAWWRAPSRPADRLAAVVLGGWAGLWIGGLGRIVIGPLPVPLGEVFWYAMSAAMLLAAAGLFFPKTVRCVSFPFAFFGVGGGN